MILLYCTVEGEVERERDRDADVVAAVKRSGHTPNVMLRCRCGYGGIEMDIMWDAQNAMRACIYGYRGGCGVKRVHKMLCMHAGYLHYTTLPTVHLEDMPWTTHAALLCAALLCSRRAVQPQVVEILPRRFPCLFPRREMHPLREGSQNNISTRILAWPAVKMGQRLRSWPHSQFPDTVLQASGYNLSFVTTVREHLNERRIRALPTSDALTLQ